jgi:hypothetical protein
MTGFRKLWMLYEARRLFCLVFFKKGRTTGMESFGSPYFVAAAVTWWSVSINLVAIGCKLL